MMRLNLEIGPGIGGFLSAVLGSGVLSYTFLRVGSMDPLHEDQLELIKKNTGSWAWHQTN